MNGQAKFRRKVWENWKYDLTNRLKTIEFLKKHLQSLQSQRYFSLMKMENLLLLLLVRISLNEPVEKEAATGNDILHFFWSSKFYFYQRKIWEFWMKMFVAAMTVQTCLSVYKVIFTWVFLCCVYFAGYTYLVKAFTLVDGRRLFVKAPLSDLVELSECSLLLYNFEFTLHVDIFISLVTTCHPLIQRL